MAESWVADLVIPRPLSSLRDAYFCADLSNPHATSGTAYVRPSAGHPRV